MSNLVFNKECNVTKDIVVDILKRRFPECTISVQKPLLGTLLVIVRKSAFVRVNVGIRTDKKTGEVKIGTSTNMDTWAMVLLGWIPAIIIHFIVRGDIENEVREILDKNLRNNSAPIVETTIEER